MMARSSSAALPSPMLSTINEKFPPIGGNLYLLFTIHCPKGPSPMQLVVVMAVRKAVSAATNIFTAISIIFFFIRYLLPD